MQVTKAAPEQSIQAHTDRRNARMHTRTYTYTHAQELFCIGKKNPYQFFKCFVLTRTVGFGMLCHSSLIAVVSTCLNTVPEIDKRRPYWSKTVRVREPQRIYCLYSTGTRFWNHLTEIKVQLICVWWCGGMLAPQAHTQTHRKRWERSQWLRFIHVGKQHLLI